MTNSDCIQCGGAAQHLFQALEIHTLHVRDLKGEKRVQALEKAAWEVAVRCAPHKRGDHDLTYLPITPETMAMKNGDLMIAYQLVPQIAVQAWNTLHEVPQDS